MLRQSTAVRNLWRVGLIYALALLVYRPILPGHFLMDDRRLVETDNPLVTGQFTPATIWFQTDFPLSTLGFWAQWRLWGANPAGYHAVNILLHALSAVLIWRVLTALKIPGAWVAGIIFAVHPVGVNSVARIAEFKNTLSLPFFLLSLLFYLKKQPGPVWYGLSLVAFVLALFSKTSTIMLPVVLLACIAWQNRRLTWTDCGRISPFFLVAAAFGMMSAWFQKHQAMTAAGSILRPESFWVKLATAGHIFWFYLGKALFPFHLNLVYPVWKMDPTSVAASLPLVLFGVMIWVCWQGRHGWRRHILFGLGVFAVLLFPVLGFFNSQFLTKWQVSDHLQYLPLVAPIALMVGGMAFILPGFLFRGVAVAVILVFSLLTFHRAKVFTSEESLFKDTLAKNPAAWGTESDLGVIFAARQNYAEAISHFQASLAVNPNNADALSNLGQALALQGKRREAEPQFVAALKIKPADVETQKRFAALLMQEHRFPEAAAHLGVALALSSQPEIRARLDYSTLLHLTGNLRGSAAQLRRVVALQPDSVEGLNNLAWMLATASDEGLRDGAEAVALAERASKLPPVKQICVPGTLAAAYAEAGRFPEAIATAEKAIETETAAGETRFASLNQHLLQYYEAGRPFHEPPPPEKKP